MAKTNNKKYYASQKIVRTPTIPRMCVSCSTLLHFTLTDPILHFCPSESCPRFGLNTIIFNVEGNPSTLDLFLALGES